MSASFCEAPDQHLNQLMPHLHSPSCLEDYAVKRPLYVYLFHLMTERMELTQNTVSNFSHNVSTEEIADMLLLDW